jgi:hypothetical protein
MTEQEKVSLSQAQQPNPGEQGYVPPTEVVPLPSRGLVYPPEFPLAGADTVEIRSMAARDEDILTSRALLKQGKAISTLIKSCMTNKSVDPDAMLVGDRNAVLVAIRITGYGATYSPQVECPACEEKADYEFDLSKLEIKPLGATPVQPGTNAFSFTLPVCKKEVVFKLMTGADEREISTILERARKAAGVGGAESGVTTRLLYQVLSLGGERDRGKLAGIIRNLPAMDARALREHIDEMSPGIEMSQHFVCPQCGEESEVDVPMGTEFFWPSGKR